jgi:hypothetical protein
MKKLMFLFVVLLAVNSRISAQIYEKTVEFDKKKYSAFMSELAYPSAAVENALVKRFAKMGYKPKQEKGIFNKDKGFYVFSAAVVSSISTSPCDYLIKFENSSRKGKESSVMTLVVLDAGEAISRDSNPEKATAIKKFLGTFDAEYVAEALELQIKAQEDAVAKTDKKLKSLQADQADLEKKLENNKQAQKDTEAELAAKNQTLEALRAKRVPAVN